MIGNFIPKLRALAPVFALTWLATKSTVLASPQISFSKGAYDVARLKDEAMHYAKALGLNDNVYIRINFTLKLEEENEATLYYKMVHDSIHQVVIYVNQRLSRSYQLLAIAHELVHVQQYVENRLIQLDDHYFKWGDEKVDIRKTPYLERPWEIEAHSLSKLLRRNYLSYSASRD